VAIIGNVLYVHIPKTGGISTIRYLYAASGGKGLWPMTPDWPFPSEHVPVSAVPTYTGRNIDSFEMILATIRDPWEQQLSNWLHWRDSYARGGRGLTELTAAMCHDMTSWLLEPMSDYRVWWEYVVRGTKLHVNDLSAMQSTLPDFYRWWLQDEDGKLPDTLRLCPFDNLEAAVTALVPSDHEFPHVNTSPARDTAQHYSANSILLVQERFRETVGGMFSKKFTPPEPNEPRQ
jgi:hypothetical protein